MSKAADQAYQRIRSRIVSGEYQPGTHLKEELVAQDTGVSRTPVREALRRLHADHLVEFIANRGAYVASWNLDHIDDLFMLRTLLEGYAAGRAASRITGEQIEVLEAAVADIDRVLPLSSSVDRATFIDANQRFHSTIVAAANSDRLAKMISSLVEMPILFQTLDTYDTNDLERSNHHHREIVDALKARDALWAQKVMETHLHAAHQVVVSNKASRPSHQAGESVQGQT
jgi:DNA-binding GntR family transcriptional regulator